VLAILSTSTISIHCKLEGRTERKRRKAYLIHCEDDMEDKIGGTYSTCGRDEKCI
jgi:hypothetical protein